MESIELINLLKKIFFGSLELQRLEDMAQVKIEKEFTFSVFFLFFLSVIFLLLK